MGIKGSKNTPITARISTGLFNQKKGVKEPLLDVGPAGVYGNNQTQDIPSPSKMRGYSMKASPFKQKADEGDIKVITTETTPDTTKTITVPGESKEVYTPPTRTKKGDEAYKKLTQAEKDIQDENWKKENTKIVPGEDVKKKVVVKGETKKRERPVQTRDSEDTQTARERSNTVRGGSRMNRKTKNNSIKEAKAQAKVDGLKGKAKRDYVKAAKNKAKLAQAKSNKTLTSASAAGAQRQAEQNRSISARQTGTVRSNERDLRESDATTATQNTLVDKQLGVNQSDTSKPNPLGNNSSTDGVTKAEKEGTDKAVSKKKSPDFFKKKSPLKMKYFK